MITASRSRRASTHVLFGGGVVLLFAACTRPAFQRYIAEARWSDARAAFESDSALMNEDWALLDAAKLYSSPGRGAYDLGRARLLLQRLLARNPPSRYRVDAMDRLALIEGVLHERDSLSAARETLDQQVVALTNDTQRLRALLDSVTARGDSLQRHVARLETDLHDREDQLRALRLELARLKQIDLNPRPAARPPQR